MLIAIRDEIAGGDKDDATSGEGDKGDGEGDKGDGDGADKGDNGEAIKPTE